jgi:hypothetical protein|tara:strand:- start:473 stop:643 length:171 start_codon:yes stop_codon:yes gene_type:complete
MAAKMQKTNTRSIGQKMLLLNEICLTDSMTRDHRVEQLIWRREAALFQVKALSGLI